MLHRVGRYWVRLVPLSLTLSLVHHFPRHSCNQPQSWHRMGTVSKNAIKLFTPKCHVPPCDAMWLSPLSWSLIVDHSFIVWYILGPMHYASIPIKRSQLEIWARFIPRLPFSWNSIISDKIWRKMSLSLSIFLVLPQISLVKYYETIKILMQIFI